MNPEGKRPTDNGGERSDPTKQSALLPSGETLQKIAINGKDRDILVDSDGRKFHEIVSSPANQMFLTRLLKGIIPVSDVLYDSASGKYLSYVMPLADIEQSPESRLEFSADSTILAFIFSDNDHFESGPHYENRRRKDNSYAIFDFEYFSEFNDVRLPAERLRSGMFTKREDPASLRILLDRLERIRERCTGENKDTGKR